MANYTKAYTIAFESDNEVFNTAIIPFLERIEALMVNNRELVNRQINGKLMRIHAYERDVFNEDYIVIPFGKLKVINKPYGMDEQTQRLVDIPDDMFDVNCLAYHSRFDIALITTNQLGPSEHDIEEYLNSYLPRDARYKIKLTPIMRNTGIEKIRNAIQARSVTVALDLGRPLNDFFRNQVEEERNISDCLRGFLDYSQNSLDSKTFTITLGLGKEKNSTLDIEALLELLDSINIDSNSVKEITVNYKDNNSTRIDIAKLKETNVILKIYFDIKANRLGAEYIKTVLEDKLLAERAKYFRQVEEHFRDARALEEEYGFVEEWNEEPIV